MSVVRLKNVAKTYSNGFVAVKDFNLDIEDKEFIIFVGPSGCGKSTTLRMIAGLEDISEGQITIDGRVINNIAPKDRDIAMVFQNYALYPHMTVFDNIAFGLKLRKMPKKEIKNKVQETAEMLGIEELLDNKPKTLSGGQRQRVAMGRAIVRKPKVFLMDEPLSNLDAKLRVQMRALISKLHKKLQTTFIYVTHDQTEAMTLGTRIVVMKDGVIQQGDTPHNLYNNPRNIFAAGFIGSPPMNFFNGYAAGEGGILKLRISDYTVTLRDVQADLLNKRGYKGKEVILGIRPEHLTVSEYDGNFGENTLPAVIEVIEMLGAETFLHLNAGQNNVIARVGSQPPYKCNDKIKLIINTDKAHIFDKDSGEALF